MTSSNMCFRFVGSIGSIIVKCKDLRVIQLDIPGMEECLNIASSIEVNENQTKVKPLGIVLTFCHMQKEEGVTVSVLPL